MAEEISLMGFPHQGQSGVGIGSPDITGAVHRGLSKKPFRPFSSCPGPDPPSFRSFRPCQFSLSRRLRRGARRLPPLSLPFMKNPSLGYIQKLVTQYKGNALYRFGQIFVVVYLIP
jgi:hypothetical protein